MIGWHDAPRVRSRRTPGAPRGPDPAAAHQPDLVSRRPGAASRVATACCRLREHGRRHPRRRIGDRGEPGPAEPDPYDTCERRPPRGGARLWAELMRRSFGLDVLACPRCGGRLRLIALIDEAAVIARILRHLHLSTEVPTSRHRSGCPEPSRRARYARGGRRPSSRPATSQRTPTCRPSCRATDRNPEARTRRRCARPSPESLPLWTSSLFRRPKRR